MRELQIRQILGDICSEIDARHARAAAGGVAIAAAVVIGQGCSSLGSATPLYAAYYDASADGSYDASMDAAYMSPPDAFYDATKDAAPPDAAYMGPPDAFYDTTTSDAADSAPVDAAYMAPPDT